MKFEIYQVEGKPGVLANFPYEVKIIFSEKVYSWAIASDMLEVKEIINNYRDVVYKLVDTEELKDTRINTNKELALHWNELLENLREEINFLIDINMQYSYTKKHMNRET